MQFIDVASILLKYCVPKADQKGETQAVIVDLVATLGFFCANNKHNQVSRTSPFQSFSFLRASERAPLPNGRTRNAKVRRIRLHRSRL